MINLSPDFYFYDISIKGKSFVLDLVTYYSRDA